MASRTLLDSNQNYFHTKLFSVPKFNMIMNISVRFIDSSKHQRLGPYKKIIFLVSFKGYEKFLLLSGMSLYISNKF